MSFKEIWKKCQLNAIMFFASYVGFGLVLRLPQNLPLENWLFWAGFGVAAYFIFGLFFSLVGWGITKFIERRKMKKINVERGFYGRIEKN